LLPTLTERDWRYILSRKCEFNKLRMCLFVRVAAVWLLTPVARYIVFARTLPQQKQDIVAKMQSEIGGNHLVPHARTTPTLAIHSLTLSVFRLR
jgi:hypothetical protein